MVKDMKRNHDVSILVLVVVSVQNFIGKPGSRSTLSILTFAVLSSSTCFDLAHTISPFDRSFAVFVTSIGLI